jgi:hypothetical protein
VASRVQRGPTLLEAKEVAQAEMARHGRRLGKLTREQEIVIEDLLIQTVTRISELVARVHETWPMVPGERELVRSRRVSL